MANDEHVAMLKQGVDAWNKWLSQHDEDAQVRKLGGLFWVTGGKGSFVHSEIWPIVKSSAVDLSRADLSGQKLAVADLHQANLMYADLTGADLSRAKLNGAFLSFANLCGANLSQAGLNFAHLNLANLAGANLKAANLYSARDITQDQLDRACGDNRTNLPPGLTIGPCPTPPPPVSVPPSPAPPPHG